MYKILKQVPLFQGLSDADLERLCESVEEIRLSAGEPLFEEGTVGNCAYVIKSGEVEIHKLSAGREVLIAVRGAGEVIGEMALLEEIPRTAGVRARVDSSVLVIRSDQLDYLLNNSPSAARAMLSTVTSRWRNTEAIVRQSEKMAQLGTLTAGGAPQNKKP